MTEFPREKTLDSTIALFSEGYLFVSNRCKELGSDVFETRIMLRPALCMLGEDAARMFYEGDHFTRQRAMPVTALRLLQDKGSVQLLDGPAHQHRKQMFMQLMKPASVARMDEQMAKAWDAYLAKWQTLGRVTLHTEVEKLLFESVCNWAGIPLRPSEIAPRTEALVAMIEGAGSLGPRNWRGQLLRARTEQWIRRIVAQVRAGGLTVPEGSPMQVVAGYRDPSGRPLNLKVAAVELLNLIRPTVAVAHYITFAALALHRHPSSRARIAQGDGAYLNAFVHEVRRFYPFFPLIGGRARHAFRWRGHRFTPGDWVLLDLYGTNHDRRIWQDPERFQPERFFAWNQGAFDYVPQGGGRHETGHRCAGEWLTIALMKGAVRRLVTAMSYEVPEQDLSVDLGRIPALPESRFVIERVRRTWPLADPLAGFLEHRPA